MKRKITRRGFLKGLTAAAAASAPCFVMPSALGLGAVPAPGNRIQLGLIGAGEMGNHLIDQYLDLPDAQIVAVCDVYDKQRTPAIKRIDHFYARRAGQGSYNGCAEYNDFRDLISDPGVDAVVIATPEHWHALPAIEAARAGKDIHLEKPLALTVEEGRKVVEAVKRHGRIFQHGTQQRSNWIFPRAVELVRNGRIGKLHSIEIGTPPGAQTEDHAPEPVPDGFDYDLWLGPAPWAPYTPMRCHQSPRDWSYNFDYGGGEISSWGVHHLDIAHWAMDLEHSGPVEIMGDAEFPEKGLWNTALRWRMELQYGNGVKVVFTDSRKQPQGIRFIGTEGWIHATRTTLEANPRSVLSSIILPDEIHVRTSANHYQNFLDCIRSRAETVSSVETAHRSTTVCHLVNICLLLGRKVRWNPDEERFIDDPDADRMISRAMRSPWRL
ncbi:MAG: Gfo/Idh/MocA family oxidoreductase [Planctomycetota bacterium]